VKSLREFLSEGAQTNIYHGGSRVIRRLEPKSMHHGNSNNQEGVGIYFGDTIEIAQTYGKKLVYIEVDKRKFVDSRAQAKRVLKAKHIADILIDALETEPSVKEDLFYFVSDYVEVRDEDDLEKWHMEEVAKHLINDEIRYLQVTLAEVLGVEIFVESWNYYVSHIHGTYNASEGFWSVINTDYRVYPV